MIDTHSHLYDEAFDEDRDDVITRARDAGINKVFLPNINADTIQPMLDMARAYPGFCYPMLGLHPEDVKEDWSEVLDAMEPLLREAGHPFIAVGEVGLDYYWDDTFYAEQQEALRRQVRWALDYDLPLMIHSRSAHHELMEVLKDELSNRKMSNCELSNCPIRGVFHCFGGTAEEAAELLRFEGFMLGIGGTVTYKKSTLPDVLRAVVPPERVVIETDSPYLAPVPHRGNRNESAFVRDVLQKLADIYGRTTAEMDQITSQNALKTFVRAQEKPVFA